MGSQRGASHSLIPRSSRRRRRRRSDDLASSSPPAATSAHAAPSALASVQRAVEQGVPAGQSSGLALQRDILTLQRTAGNAAVQRLLASNLHQTAAPNGGQTLQRYPDTVFQSPYRGWQGATDSVFSPGRGLMGGVFILKGRSGRMFGPVESAVVKPLAGQGKVLGADGFSSPEQAQLSDSVLREFGVDTPDSRVIMPGTPEFAMLKNVSEGGSGKQFGPDVNSIKLMSKVPGQGLKEMAEGPDGGMTRVDVDRLVEVLGDPQRFYKIGELMVVDTLMNNVDRITTTMLNQKINLDNIMVTMNSFVAIDSAALLMESSFGKEMDLTLMQGLLTETKVTALLNAVLEVINTTLGRAQGKDGFNPMQYFTSRFGEGDVTLLKGWIMDGIAGGKQRVRAFAHGKDQSNRGRRQRVKAQAGTKYSQEGSIQSSYTVLKGRAKYMTKYDELIEANVPPNEAHEQAKQHAQEYINTKVNERRREEIGDLPLSEHMQRVLDASDMTETEKLTVKMGLKRGNVSVDAQDKMLHIRPGIVKMVQNHKVDARLEAIRAAMLKIFAKQLGQWGDQGGEEFQKVIDKTRLRANVIRDLRVWEAKPSNARLTAIAEGLKTALNAALADQIMAAHFPKPR